MSGHYPWPPSSTARLALAEVNSVLRRHGFEYPLGPRGVNDALSLLAAQRDAAHADLAHWQAEVGDIWAELQGVDTCVFDPCPGPDQPLRSMVTCVVCAARIRLRALLDREPS